MFTIFKRPKPKYKVGQLVEVLNDGLPEHCYVLIRKRRWVRQSSACRWDWFYVGPTLRIIENKIALWGGGPSSYWEKDLGKIVF